jgi:hypothetical protein
MSVTNPIITINGVSLTTGQLSNYKLTYNKLWKNADRNMNGDISATLIGVYPNISMTTSILDFAFAESLSSAVNDDYFSVTFWDTQTGSHKTAQYYAADHEITLLNECKYGQVTIELVAVSKANYI